MFLLPRKRRSAAAIAEAATPNQRSRLTPSEVSSTLDVQVVSSTRDALPAAAGAAAAERTPHEYRNHPSLFVPSSSRAHGDVLLVDGKRVFPCRVCGYRFSASSNRSRHERNKHAVGGPATVQTTGGASTDAAMGKAALDSASSNHPGALGPSTSLLDEADANMDKDDPQGAEANCAMTASMNDDDDTPLSSDPCHTETVETLDIVMSDSAPSTSSSEEATLPSEAAHPELVEPAASSATPAHEPLGALALLQDTQLQSECLPFLRWMCTPPITQVEALVKARRVTSMTQLQPIKLNLRFLFGLLLEAKAIDAPELQLLTRLSVCQALNAALEQRQVGHGRFHAMFLLVKKVLVYLSSQESNRRHQFLTPTMHESFLFVENVCSDSSHRRKQEARNRTMLGMQTSKMLHAVNDRSSSGSSTLSAEAFRMPSMLGANEGASTASRSSASQPVSPEHASSLPFPSSAQSSRSTTSSESERPTPNELTCEELKVVAKGSLAYLQQYREPSSAAVAVPAHYIHHLVTAILCLGMAPRSQVLKQLRIGSSFVKEADGRYWVKMLAELNKNGKPTAFALPKELTEPFDFYLTTLRPKLLHDRGQQHDYVFFKRNGTAPRTDFSDLTTVATQQLIQRPVNPHAFR